MIEPRGTRRLLPQPLPVGQDALGPAEEPLAFGGKALEALVTAHDGDAEFLLQVLDAHRQGRLRDVAKLGRAGEVTGLGQRYEVFELADEHGSPSAGDFFTNAQSL